MAEVQLKKVSWWHKSIVDWELEHPSLMLGDCARAFNVSQTWLSVIRNSDAFRAYEEGRRAEHNSNVSKSIIDRVEEVAEISLDVLHERIKKEKETIGLREVNNTAALALKALGFGQPKNRNDASVNVNFNFGADQELLASARAKMKLINSRTIEQEPEILADGNEMLEPLPATA